MGPGAPYGNGTVATSVGELTLSFVPEPGASVLAILLLGSAWVRRRA